MIPVERAYEAVKSALAPSRQLDAIVAEALSPEMLWRGERLQTRHLRMAFTRGLENADRFVSIALPKAEWSVGNNLRSKTYQAIIWADNGPETEGEGPTPALALLKAALCIGRSTGGFRSTPPSGVETIRQDNTSGGL